MNAEELYTEWTEGESTGMRPKRVQVVRDDLEEAIGVSVPRSIPEIEGWMERMYQSGVLTRKLREAAEGSDEEDGDDEVEEDDEGADESE